MNVYIREIFKNCCCSFYDSIQFVVHVKRIKGIFITYRFNEKKSIQKNKILNITRLRNPRTKLTERRRKEKQNAESIPDRTGALLQEH